MSKDKNPQQKPKVGLNLDKNILQIHFNDGTPTSLEMEIIEDQLKAKFGTDNIIVSFGGPIPEVKIIK
jgi:hypothetical protein